MRGVDRYWKTSLPYIMPFAAWMGLMAILPPTALSYALRTAATLLIGVVCLVAAVITGSAYGVISRGISDEFTVYERTYFMQVMGAVFYTVLALTEQRGSLGAIIAPLANGEFVLSMLFLSLGASVLGYSLFNYAVSNAPMANVISLCNLTTVISVAAGIVLLNEPFSPVSVIAMLAVLVGIWGVQKFPPKEQS